MRAEKIAVDVEVDVRSMAGMSHEEAVKHVINLTRGKADEVARDKRATVRTDRLPEIRIGKGTHVLAGVEMLLVHTVWHVEVPDRAVLPGPEVVL